MTSYHGGKQKFGKEIAYEIFLNSIDRNIEIKGYCEPFCGMMGVYQHIHDIFDNKIKYKAGDLNESVILLWKKLKTGWKPPKKISENEYNEIKKRDGKTKVFEDLKKEVKNLIYDKRDMVKLK